MAQPGFWDNQELARTVIDESNSIKGWLEPWRVLDGRVSDLRALAELLEEEDDEDLAAEFGSGVAEFAKGVEALEVRTMLQGEDDHRGAIITIHPGAGGLESQDWAQMLLRMYTRWAEDQGMSVRVNELSEGEEAGIKSTTIEIEGRYAYGYLRNEKGTH